MAFAQVPLKLVGASSQNRSHMANNELTKNWYPQIPDGNPLFPAILLPWMGSSIFSEDNGILDRGLWEWEGVLYHVLDQTLYSVSTSGVYTSIGTILGSTRCVFSSSIVGSNRQMVIAAGNVYTYDGTTLADSGLDANSVTYLNSKSIYPNGGMEFAVSGAGGAVDIQEIGSAESTPDDLLRPYAFNQWCYMFKERSIEPFYDAGVNFARIDSAIMQKGLGGFYTIANTDQALYFLADDSCIYQIIQSQLTKVSTPSIFNSIKNLNKDFATAYTMNVDGQEFYVLWFPNGMTFVYAESIGEWFNLSSGVNNEPYLASSYIRIYGKDLAVDYRTGDLIELSFDTYTDLGEPIQRRRVLPPFTSIDAGLPYGKRLLMSKIKFALQKGVGIVTGQGVNPKIMVEYSLDGGETWSTERWIEIGMMGQYLMKAEYWEMVSFYEITFRITVSDPVFTSLYTATIDVKEAGY
jgi:hypothetical protein